MSPPVQDTVSEIDTSTGDDTEETNASSRFDSKGLTPITLTDKAQEKLFDLGFVEVGTADGVVGANTRSAARRYQGASDLTVNGRLNGDTLGSLTSATADLDTIMQRQIAFHEGQKNYPYKDSLGLWTIGIGHLIGSGSDEDLENSGYSQYSRVNPMPDSDVTELFQEDLTDHKAIAEGYDFYDDMNEKGKRAIIDLTFNMGDFLNKRNENGTYMWANLREQLANSDWDAAADNLASATYGRQVGQRAITVTDMLRQAGE
jgi:GH24 family phage-related lysozyme (muramidase)